MCWSNYGDITSIAYNISEGAGTKYYFLHCYEDEEISEKIIEQTRIEKDCDVVQVIKDPIPIRNRFEILDL